jgi:type IV pilus assembly protein PilC
MWRMAILKQRVVSALTYPLIVLVLLLAISGVIYRFIVPTYMGMFKDLQIELPDLTKALVFVSTNFYFVMGTIVGIAVAVYLAFRFLQGPAFCLYVKRWIIFHIPLLGRVLKSSYLSRFCRTMSLLLTSGTPLDTALELTGEMDTGATAPGGTAALALAVRKGISLADAMLARVDTYPQMLSWMVRTSEKTGRLPEAFRETADMYERDAERNIQVMSAVMPAVFIVAVAILVGLAILGIFLPLIKLMSSLS